MNIRRLFSLVATALLLVPLDDVAVGAQATSPPPQTSAPATAPGNDADVRTSNFFDLIGRGTIFAAGSDEARFQRYRDLRDGGTLDAFRYKNDTDSKYVAVSADHIGYRDQRYAAAYNKYGKLKATFEWNQIPIFFSQTTATLFSEVSPGVLRMSDAIQGGVENKTTTLAAAVGQAQLFDLRAKRNVLDVRLVYSATRNLDLNLTVKNTTKDGNQPWAGTFGFSDAVELPVPLDTRTTELGTSAEWTNGRGMARVGYDGSFFRNNVGTLVWDNPQRITDSPTAGPLQGRMALWPNSDQNAVTASGMVKLPRNSRATAYVSVGNWTQNDPLIPFTINSGLTTIPLDRATADAKAVVTAMTYTFSSKPASSLWVSARYRSYDFDNQTPVFHLAKTVAYDTSAAAFAEGGTSPYAFTRRTFDADASFTPVPFTALRVGYTREQLNQTFRIFDTTTEDTVRLSADATGVSWLTLRGVYEHARRVGTGFDEQTLDDIGEQTSLRQFDISDRNSDRFSTVVQLMPASALSFNGTVSAGREDRPETVFGLRSNNSRAYSIGMDFVPRDAVSFGMSYEYEKYTVLQGSRQANPGPQFDDPTRDWTTDSADKAHTVSADLDLIKLWPKTDLRFAYNLSRARSTYVYGLAPNSSLPPVVQLPAVLNELQRATIDMRYYVTRHLAAGFAYWFDKYEVNDFALGQETGTTLAQPSFLTLGYLYRPYTANTLMGRLTYLW